MPAWDKRTDDLSALPQQLEEPVKTAQAAFELEVRGQGTKQVFTPLNQPVHSESQKQPVTLSGLESATGFSIHAEAWT